MARLDEDRIFRVGVNLSNPNPPFFHFTERGRRALERLSRDPEIPPGTCVTWPLWRN
jgi:hypothetical protein